MAAKKSRSSAAVCGEIETCGVPDAPDAAADWALAEVACVSSMDENIALKMMARRKPAIDFIRAGPPSHSWFWPMTSETQSLACGLPVVVRLPLRRSPAQPASSLEGV